MITLPFNLFCWTECQTEPHSKNNSRPIVPRTSQSVIVRSPSPPEMYLEWYATIDQIAPTCLLAFMQEGDIDGPIKRLAYSWFFSHLMTASQSRVTKLVIQSLLAATCRLQPNIQWKVVSCLLAHCVYSSTRNVHTVTWWHAQYACCQISSNLVGMSFDKSRTWLAAAWLAAPSDRMCF